MRDRLYTGGLLSDQHTAERLRPPGIVHLAEPDSTARRRLQSRQSAALISILCAAAIGVIAAAAWLATL